MSTVPDSAISIRDLIVKRGGREILHGLSCQIAAGSVTGLLGPSGCGKSTLMRAVVGVQIVAGGTVEVLGAAAGSKALRSEVGYVTQAPSVYADLSIAENLHYFAAIVGASSERIAATTRRSGWMASRIGWSAPSRAGSAHASPSPPPCPATRRC